MASAFLDGERAVRADLLDPGAARPKRGDGAVPGYPRTAEDDGGQTCQRRQKTVAPEVLARPRYTRPDGQNGNLGCQLPIHYARMDARPSQKGARKYGEILLLQSVIALCRGLEIETIVDGVASEAQQQTLTQLGYPFAQGHRFGQPQKPEQLDRWFREGVSR